MDGQLVAGQWVEVAMEDLPTPISLSGFVLRSRAGELLLTFPELPIPPKGLESEAQATLRYSNEAGRFSAIGQIQRVSSGPPVTVTFKRLSPLGLDARRAPVRVTARLPVAVHALSSSVATSAGQIDGDGWTDDLSASGLLLSTSLLLAVGDVLQLRVLGEESVEIYGRVVRVHESDSGEQGRFGVGVELHPRSHAEHQRWLGFAGRLQNRSRR